MISFSMSPRLTAQTSPPFGIVLAGNVKSHHPPCIPSHPCPIIPARGTDLKHELLHNTLRSLVTTIQRIFCPRVPRPQDHRRYRMSNTMFADSDQPPRQRPEAPSSPGPWWKKNGELCRELSSLETGLCHFCLVVFVDLFVSRSPISFSDLP